VKVSTQLAVSILLLSGLRADAASLKGVIIADQLGGTPISGISVSALGANSTKTGASGTFELNFPIASREILHK
jgi:hypothetical protein